MSYATPATLTRLDRALKAIEAGDTKTAKLMIEQVRALVKSEPKMRKSA